jgi:hypothetical protein
LTRLPTVEQRHEFVSRLNSTQAESGSEEELVRQKAIEDLFWDLINVREFSWNH